MPVRWFENAALLSKMVWEESYPTSGADVGSDPTQVKSQDVIINADFSGNFGVHQKFDLHRVDK